MNSAKTIIALGIGAIAAIAIYGLASTKKASTDDLHKDRLARLEALMDEGKVQYRPSFFRKRIHHVDHEQVAGLEPAKSVTLMPEAAKPTVDPKAEAAKKAAEAKKAADEKKKKDDAAKKKKKKKKKKSQDAAAPDVAANDSGDKKADEKKPEELSAVMQGGLSGLPIAGANAQHSGLPETTDEWIAYLFGSPSFEKTSKFIQLRQNGTVKAEVFYPVVEKMLASNQDEMLGYGVMCLGATPSVESFQYLSLVASEQTIAEKFKTQASNYMKVYSQLQYVRLLGIVASIQSGEIQATSDAIILINQSLASLRGVTPTTPTNPNTAATRSPASSLTKIYEGILTSLQAVIASTNDTTVKANATNTAQAITQALQALQTTPATTGAPGVLASAP